MWRSLIVITMTATSALGGVPTFTNLDAGTPPGNRRSSGGALQSTLTVDTFVTFGGFNAGTLADLNYYRSAGNAWTNQASVLPARERHGLAYDPASDLFVIVGGANLFTTFDTVFLINGTTLAGRVGVLPAVRPSARIDGLFRWIPAWGRFFYFGGRTTVTTANHVSDSWTLEVSDGGVTWTQLVVSSAPSARGASCSAVDPSSGRVILFGGEGAGNALLQDTWFFDTDGGGWSLQSVSGTVPSARGFSACVWDPRLQELVLYGGQAPAGPVSGLYSFNPATRVWTSYPSAVAPGPLSDAAAAFSPVHGGTLFFAGRSSGSVYTNQTWLLTFNLPPVVTAGPDVAIGENVVATLSSTIVDPEGDLTNTSWAQIQGPAVTLSDPMNLRPTFVTPTVFTPTVLRFTLTGRDLTNPPVSAQMHVTVLNDINERPIALAGPNQMVASGAMVGLTGAGTDPNGDPIVGFGWSQTAGPVVTLSSTAVATPTFTAPIVAVSTVLSFELTVNDGVLGSNPASVFITVAAPPDAGSSALDAGVDAGSDAGNPDAGELDGGEDAGFVDAGVDAGDFDAGTRDAGAGDAGAEEPTDAGRREPQRLQVGCGCSEVPFSATWLFLAASWFLRRRSDPSLRG